MSVLMDNEIDLVFKFEDGKIMMLKFYYIIIKVIVYLNVLVFFGEDLVKNERFMKVVMIFIE